MNGQPPGVVLLIEDHADSREMYADVLGASGFDVLAVESGADALAQASLHPPSLVITDMRMPGTITSLDICRHFAEARVPVIVVTGVSPGPEQDAAREAGCALLVMKPFGPDKLVSVVQRLLAVNASEAQTPNAMHR
jgi:CheY-like chemotaxis protein